LYLTSVKFCPQLPAEAILLNRFQGSPTGEILQQLLTQAITQSLTVQDPVQAGQFLQSQINSAFGLD
jgi:hypothetical protein